MSTTVVICRRVVAVVAVVLSALLMFAQTASAGVRVTDEQTGQTFEVRTVVDYSCGAPCSLSFSYFQTCPGYNVSYSWTLYDANGTMIDYAYSGGPFNPAVPIPPTLGLYRIVFGEQASNCGTGSTLWLHVVDKAPPPDTSPPETTITFGPVSGGVTINPTATIEFSSSEPGSTFVCRFDGKPFELCSSPLIAPSLSDGPHVFEVQATDPAGNTDATPASLAFRVRRPQPVPARLRGAWSHQGRTTRVRRLEVVGVPSMSTVSIRCSGRGCPFALRSYKPRRGAVNLSWSFRSARLRPATVIRITVSAPSAVAKVFTITVRRPPLAPRVQTRLVPIQLPPAK